MHLTFLLPCVIASTLAAQSPILAVDRLHHTFGRISPHEKVTTRFELVNGGDALLELRRVQTSCGCTTALPERPFLKPGEHTTLEVQYDPHKDRGHVYRGVSIFSNDPKQGRLDLQLEAEVVPSVVLSEYAFFFGGLLRSDRLERSARVVSTTGKTLHSKGLQGSMPPYLTASVAEQGADLEVRVKLDASRLPPGVGTGTQEVTLRTDDAETPEVTLEVHWATGQAFVTEPAKLAFPPTPAGTSPSLPLQIRQVRNKPFHILGAQSSSPCFRIEPLDPSAALEQALKVTFLPDGARGVHTGRLLIKTDDGDQVDLNVDVMAFLQ